MKTERIQLRSRPPFAVPAVRTCQVKKRLSQMKSQFISPPHILDSRQLLVCYIAFYLLFSTWFTEDLMAVTILGVRRIQMMVLDWTEREEGGGLKELGYGREEAKRLFSCS